SRLSVRDHRDLARFLIAPEELVPLAAADVLVEDEAVAGARAEPCTARALGVERELRARPSRGFHALDLNDVGEAGADEHLAAHGMPGFEGRAPRLGARRDALGERLRKRGPAGPPGGFVWGGEAF